MTYENCKKYYEEAEDEKTRKFWQERIKRKYPDKVSEVPEVEEVKQKRSKK
jgi:hypothetical protein